MLTGDFFQLPPVQGIGLYMAFYSYSTGKKEKSGQHHAWFGPLMKLIIGILCLTESKHIDGDPPWKIAMMRARHALYLSESQVLHYSRTSAIISHKNPKFVDRFVTIPPKIVTMSNVDRHNIRRAITRKFAAERLVIDSTPDSDGNLNPDPFQVFLQR